jgi:hypothetical protein
VRDDGNLFVGTLFGPINIRTRVEENVFSTFLMVSKRLASAVSFPNGSISVHSNQEE